MSKLRFFNLDLHISVIADIKDICARLFGDRIEITNWSISGHNWVFKNPTPNVDIITQRTWRNINPSMISAFQERYGEMLKTFDGFIVTHTPIFALLYEPFGKPIIMINSCRYEQPYCWSHDIPAWRMLNTKLRTMSDRGQLIAVSNNKADQEYLRRGTGIVSEHIPSLCLYTNLSEVIPTRREAVVYGERGFFPKCDLLVEKPRPGYSWSDLYSFKAIVHLPYEISTMSLFEQYSAGIPLFLPTPSFYWKCIQDKSMHLGSSYTQISPDELTDTLRDTGYWLSRADYYDTDNFRGIYYYDSREDLIAKIEKFEDTNRDMRLSWISKRRDEILSKWMTLFRKHYSI
jgi:hypothetical protein